MLEDVDLVIVPNVHTKLRDMKPYLDLADEYGYEIELIRAPGPWDTDTLYQHGVKRGRTTPKEAIQGMIDRYQPHKNDVEWTDLSIFQKEE
jgi:predicted kinase